MIEQNDPRLVYMKKENILNHVGFCQIIKDRWFVVTPMSNMLIFYQPDRKRYGSLLGASPQCNSNDEIITQLKDKMYPWADIMFFERVACPIDLKDYV